MFSFDLLLDNKLNVLIMRGSKQISKSVYKKLPGITTLINAPRD